MFDKITIIGFGLIGSSLARIIKDKKLTENLVCSDLSVEVCKKVDELRLAGFSTSNLCEAVKDSDLIILATPLGAYKSICEEISSALKKNSIVIDVGSAKQKAIENISSNLPDNVFFVPSHPVAGSEKSGPESGFAELFKNRWAIITPLPDTPEKIINKVKSFWESCGSNVEIMNPKHHDLVLAITSHLPHLIAYSIVDTAATLENHTKSEVIKYSAGGFRDFTRIAASNPVMWRDIFLDNKESVLEILQRFTEDLTALQRAIRIEDGDMLEKVFSRTRKIRKDIIDANKNTVDKSDIKDVV